MIKKNDPIVSITVLTYNSSRYVIETLDSIKNQSYTNIELVVSDDCSTDDTVEICKNWINKNKGRFVANHLITSVVNTGVPANLNRAIVHCKGIWLKGVAGDDALYKDAIKSFIDFVKQNKNITLLSSSIDYFENSLVQKNLIKTRNDFERNFYKLTANEQYKSLLHGNQIHALGVFLKKEIIDKVGGYDEKYRLLEDHPMWLKLTKSGHKCFYMDKVTVKYRIHDASIFSSVQEEFLFNQYYLAKRTFDKDYILPNLSLFYRISLNYTFYHHKLFDLLNLNRNNYINRKLYAWSTNLNPKLIKTNLSNFLRKFGLLGK